MTAEPSATAAKAVALANGLRKSVVSTARRWSAWPRGAEQFGALVACIDRVRQRATDARAANDEAAAAACMADLRAVLEWTTYHTATLTAARAVLAARRTRTLSRDLGLLDDAAAPLLALTEAEGSLIASIREKNGHLQALAERHPGLALPQPLVTPQTVALPPQRPPGRLAMIQALKDQTRSEPRKPRPL